MSMASARIPYQFLFIIGLALILNACTSQREDQYPSGSVWVKVPKVTPQGNAFETVELKTVSNMQTMEGSLIRFLSEAKVSDNQLTGFLPNIRTMRTAEGVYVATDTESLQLITLYSHFEKLADLDRQTGTFSLLKWPRPVAVNLRVQGEDGLDQNNALYSQDLDGFLFLPYTQAQLPLMANGGVIAHEHFHSIFHQLVTKAIGQKGARPLMLTVHNVESLSKAVGVIGTLESEFNANVPIGNIYHEVLLRGINEGLADVWGWNYSQDLSFVGRSLPAEKSIRSLDIPASWIFSVDEIAMRAKNMDQNERNQLSYQIGTQLARTIRGFYELSSTPSMEKSQLKIAARLVQLLKDLALDFAKTSESESYRLSRVLELFLTSFAPLSDEQCSYVFQKIRIDELVSLKLLCPRGAR